MNDVTSTPEATTANAERTTLLTVFCVLSFIAGLSRIIYYTFAVLIVSGGSVQVNGEEVTTGDKVVLVIGLLLTLASLYGIMQMWKLQKKGFYFYTGASIISLIMISIGSAGFPFFTLVIAILFIAVFAANLKHMK